jgi:plastocyanin
MYPTQPDPRGSSHRPLVWAVGLLAIIALLLLAACGGSVSGAVESATATTAITVTATATATQDASNIAATIAMDEFNFKGNTNVTIKVGQAINFDDTKGGPHVLVIGTNGTFHAQNGAPPELNSASGITVSGDAKPITFPTAGAYQITCTLHPDMQATVTVR